ncbi:TATE DNA Transposon [Leptomonas pyrrhocoris]|uniref:TATE DNA Transposon n=1 Tax=Leptomonas pyrrhocoris TaxID=157538 RepID=A0A0N0VF52_LEPPY|nr:TATE DNA Transposon [Leptomonas pyrrhocoris]KPA80251.1 TATE DNA Transposon [Leptomonas pyrrhocoris]|eukprot:XP_015658690.1 TATE DNA Transposon [Leptomonas pyrrhocoris]
MLTQLPRNNKESAVALTTYASAPSPVVEEELRSVFVRGWPRLCLVRAHRPHQERDSSLYMTANCLGNVLNVLMVDCRDLPACLRLLLLIAKQHKPLQHYSLKRMCRVLMNHRISRKNPFCEEIALALWKRQRAWPWWCVAGSAGAGRDAVYRCGTIPRGRGAKERAAAAHQEEATAAATAASC